MKKLMILSLALLASFAAHAAGSVNSVVVSFWAAQGGVMLVNVSAISTPSCTNNTRFAIDTSTAQGALQAASVRYAAALGKSVTFYGTGTCSAAFTDSESLASMLVSN